MLPTSAPVHLMTEVFNDAMRCVAIVEVNPGKHLFESGSGVGSGRSRGFKLSTLVRNGLAEIRR